MSKELIAKLEAENAYLRRNQGIPGNAQIGPPPMQERTYAVDECNMQAGQQGMTQTPEECIDFLFTFHDDPDKTPHYVEIRESAKTFAKVIVRHTPGGADRLTAINKLREVVMFANACVALSGRGI